MSEQISPAPPSRKKVFLALLGLWGAVFLFYGACFFVLAAGGIYGLFRSLAPAATPSASGQSSQLPTRTPYITPTFSPAVAATVTRLAETGGFVPLQLPIAATAMPVETPLPTLAPRTVVLPQVLPTLAPRTTILPLDPGSGFQIYRVVSQSPSPNVEIETAAQDARFFNLVVRYTAPDDKPVSLARPGDPNAFYIVSEGVRYPLFSAGGIALGESRAMRVGEVLMITLHFDPLTDPTQPFDLLEGEHSGSADTRYWDVRDIRLQPSS